MHDDLIASLHEYERAVLPILGVTTDHQEIIRRSKLDDIRLSRAYQWLSNKGLIQVSYDKYEVVDLDEYGRVAAKKGFAEEIFLNSINDGKEYSLKEISQQSGLSSQEVGASMGLLKAAGAITTTTTNDGIKIKSTGKGIDVSEYKAFLALGFPKEKTELHQKDQAILAALQRRPKFVTVEKKQSQVITLTALGKEVAVLDLGGAVSISVLTSAMIRQKEYVGKKFRPFDVTTKVPYISAGRMHPMTAIIRQIRQIFLEMGFVEMSGTWVESQFWCMDSMWIPQDHPARDVQDTFFLGQSGDLPSKDIVEKVKTVHEKGAKDGYNGYAYKWDAKKAAELILRTHTTASTFRMFGGGVKTPCKYFSIDRVFRNEAIDATHLPEFHQVEGFVVAPNLTLADLLGFIKEFFAKLGYTKIRFKPTYNPYTESSIEAFYYDEKRGKWMELINSGIFRPESMHPYGINGAVLGWGLGLERLAMLMLEQQKLKDFIGPTTDLAWLATYKQPIVKSHEILQGSVK